jgi:uncharacterized protein
MDHGLAAPVRQTQRYASIDVLRGFALLGILAMNVMIFAMPMAAYQNPTIFTQNVGTDRLTYWIVHTLFDLKMMGMFSMLFGAGVVIWSRKADTREETKRLRWLWLRRMFWLLIFGLIHGWLIWEGDILYAYALSGLIVVWWLRRLPPVWLIIVACAFFAVHILLAAFQGLQVWVLFSESERAAEIRGQIPPEDLAAGLEGLKSYMAPTPAMLKEDLAALRGDWLTVFRHRAEMTKMIEIQGFLFYIFWRAAAMMLLGIALTKAGVFTGQRSARFYAAMAAIGYGLGLPLLIGGIAFNESHGFDIVKFNSMGVFFNLIGAVPMMLGHAGLILWVVKKGYLSLATSALARVGQMAFTNYLMQSVLCSLIFYGWGLGFAGEFGRLGQELIVVGIWIVQILWSVAWLSRFRFGPAEWLWRSLTYWELQPMRRLEAVAEPAGAPLDKAR